MATRNGAGPHAFRALPDLGRAAGPDFDSWGLKADRGDWYDPLSRSFRRSEPVAWDLSLRHPGLSPLLVFAFTLAVFFLGFLSTLWLLH